MKYPQRLFLLALCAAALVLHGCSCSSSRSTIESDTVPPPAQTFELSGMASKGILINASISAYSIEDGALSSTAIATSSTNAQGRFTLALPQARQNAPVLLRIEALSDGSTLMRCDLTYGCGDDVSFGEDVAIGADDEFVLESVIEGAVANQPANVTLLTHLAAQQAKDSGFPSDPAALRLAIAQANSQVANRFGVTGRLTSVPVIDLTDADAVNAALAGNNSRALHMAAINAAMLQAQLSKNPGSSIALATRTFSEVYVQQNGLAGNTTSTTMPGYNEILQAAQNILVRVQSLTPETPINLAALLAELAAEQQLAANEPPDTYNPGSPSESAGQAPMDQVKAMVTDLRDLSLSIGGATLEGEQTLRSAAEEFHLQLEAAEMATSMDMHYLIDALTKTAEAVEAADRAYRADPDLNYYEHYGITVHIEVTDDIPHFTVEQDVPAEHQGHTTAVSMDIVASWHLNIETGENDNRESASGTGSFSLTGSAVSEHLQLTLHNGSNVSLALEIHRSEDEAGAPTEHTMLDLEGVQMDLHVTLTQREAENPVSLAAHIELDIGQLSGEELETENESSIQIDPSTLSLRMAGEVSNDLGNAYQFSLAAHGDARGASFANGRAQESALEYADFSASAIFNATLAGIPDVVVVSYNLVRTGLNSGENTLTLRYFPGKLLRLQAPIVDGELSRTVTVTNQDGVILTLTEIEDAAGESRREGNITLDGTVYANIEESSTGVITIRYTDETFESL